MNKDLPNCPKCGDQLIEIVYGMPGPELFEASERGEVILGGCCITGDDPKYHCKKCKLDYSRDLKQSFEVEEYEDE